MSGVKERPESEETGTRDLEELRKHLLPGSVVYTIRRGYTVEQVIEDETWNLVNHHYTDLSVVLITKDGGPWEVTGMVARILGYERTKTGRIRVDAGGIDPGFHVVYNLSTAVFPGGFFCTGHPSCPSVDHPNGDTSYGVHHHGDGGYALRHQWI